MRYCALDMRSGRFPPNMPRSAPGRVAGQSIISRLKKVISPLFLLLFVQNLLLILTILILNHHEGEERDTNDMTSKR